MIYEPLFKLERTGVQIHYYTGKGKYNPVHWHSAIELIYVLNGNGSIMIDGKEYLVGHTPEYVKAALPKEECEKMHAASGVILEAQAKEFLTSDILLLKNTIAE